MQHAGKDVTYNGGRRSVVRQGGSQIGLDPGNLGSGVAIRASMRAT